MREQMHISGRGRHDARTRALLIVVLLVLAAICTGDAPAAAAAVVFEDNFDVSFAGWTTSGTPDWYSNNPRNGTHSIQLRGTESIQRTVSTVCYQDVTVSFYLAARRLEGADTVRALWFDGSVWYVLKVIADGDPEEDGLLHYFTFPLPASAANNANLAVRFESNGNNPQDFGYVDDVLIQGDIIQYTLSLSGSNGSVTVNGTPRSLPWSGSFDCGSVVNLDAVPDSCYEFTGWSGDLGGAVNPTTITMDAGKAVTANFAILQYTLSLSGSNGSVTVNGTPRSLPWSGVFDCGSVVNLDAVPDGGWDFAGWSGDVTWSGGLLTVTMDSSKNITANFSEQPTLSLAQTGNGSVKVNGTLQTLPWSGQFASGTEVTLEATPDSGWAFDGWSGDATWSGNQLTVTVDAPKNITATFSQEGYILALSKVGSGSAKVNGTLHALPWSGNFVSGSSVSLEAVPDSGWEFDGWSGDATWGGASLTVTMDDDNNLTANFGERDSFILSLSKTGAGEIEVDGVTVSLPWSGELPRASVVTLQAAPDSGWRFNRWSGDLADSQNPTAVTMSADMDITAKFAEIHRDLTITAVGSGQAKVNGDLHWLPWTGEFALGTQIELEAVPEGGWDFDGWSGDLSAKVNPAVFTLDGDRSIIATFLAPDQFELAITKSGSGSVNVDGAEQSLPWSGMFASGAQVTVEAVPDPTGLFLEWSGDVTGSTNPITLTMDSNKSIKARFMCTAGPFSDVPCDHWAADAIAAVYDADIANGYANGQYLPDLAVTRAAMAVFLSRGLTGGTQGVPAGPQEATFSDVPTDHWAFDEVEYIVSKSVTEGYGDGSYQPAWQITRAQMAAFVARAVAEPTGEEGLSAFDPPDTPSFSDVPASLWCYRHVEYLVGQGMLTGYSDGLYRPTATVTRDQMAVYVARAFGLLD